MDGGACWAAVHGFAKSRTRLSNFTKGSAIRYINTQNGIVRNIDGLLDAQSVEGVVQVTIVHGVGEKIGEIKSSVDRVAFAISQAENSQKAVDIAEKSIQKLKYQF